MSDEKLASKKRGLMTDVMGGKTQIDRRRLFVSAGAFGAAAVVAGHAGAQPPEAAPGEAKAGPPSEHKIALASPQCPADQKPAGRYRTGLHKDLTRVNDLNGTNQGGQWWRFNTFITPIEDFFIRNEYGTPTADVDRRVDPRYWTLKIHGEAVERELTITYDDLLKMPSLSIIAAMECAGNGRSLFWEQQGMTSGATKVTGTGWGLGGVGQAEWEYVPMSHILGLVGLKKNAKAALFWSGVDGAKQPGANPTQAGRCRSSRCCCVAMRLAWRSR